MPSIFVAREEAESRSRRKFTATENPRSPASSAVAAPMPRPPPVTSRTFLAATQEKLVEVGEGELVPRRPAVVAAARALGFLHLAQQRVHLCNREGAVGAHRGVAGHGGEQLVLPRGEHG